MSQKVDTMNARCRKEVIELHEFFVGWFEGTLSGDESFERFSRVMAEGFEIISPEGRKMSREMILDAVRGAKGQQAGLRIWIDNYEGRAVNDDVQLASYEEWQRTGGRTRARLSTVLFRRRENTPNGVEWLHVHETWLPEKP